MGKLTCSVTKVRSYVRKNNCGCKNMHKCAKKMKCEKCDSNKTYCIFHKKSPANLEKICPISDIVLNVWTIEVLCKRKKKLPYYFPDCLNSAANVLLQQK